MSNDKHNKITAAFVVLALCLCSCFVAIGNDDSYAASDATYGTINEFDLAPGFKWTYAPTYPSDLSVTTTILTQGTNTSSGTSSSIVTGTTWATMSGSSVIVTVPSNTSVGTVYDVILKATTNTGGVSQTAYQYLRVNVTEGLTAQGTASDVILGNDADVELTASSSMGAVTWAVTSGESMPAGLTLSDGNVTGKPTTLGLNTIYLTASAKGQSVDVSIPFTVYNKIVGGTDETIRSYSTTVSSTAIVQTGDDLGVTWSVTNGTLPSGFTLNEDTGVITGSSAERQSVTVTITGTAANGPTQTVTKNVTIQSEPKFTSITGNETVITYTGNTSDVTETYASEVTGTSTLTWELVGAPSGVSIDNAGVLTVKGTASVTSGTDFTIKATSEYGQTISKTVKLIVEDTLNLTGEATLGTTVNTTGNGAYTATGGSSNTFTVDKSNVPSGVTVNIDNDGNLTLDSSSPCSAFNVDITVTSAAGQTDTITVTCQVVNVLIYTSTPSNGVIAYAV